MKKGNWITLAALTALITLVGIVLKHNREQAQTKELNDESVKTANKSNSNGEITLKTIEEHLKKQDVETRKSNFFVPLASLGVSTAIVGISVLLGKQIATSAVWPSNEVFLIVYGLAIIISAGFWIWVEERSTTARANKAKGWFRWSFGLLGGGILGGLLALLLIKYLSLHTVAFYLIIASFVSVFFGIISCVRGTIIRLRG